jgi:protein involved in polysaccharide export with SLBB domain
MAVIRRGALALCLPAALAALLAAGGARAQQSLGIQPNQLMQLQQQFQQRAGQSASQAENNPEIVIQPVRPENQVRLPPSRLEQIMSGRAGARLQQFGYDQLGSGRSVTVPQTGAVQDDYVLGPGDEIVVSLRGQENNEFRLNVDRNGQVAIPRLNPIAATGRSFGSFRQDVAASVSRAYVATSAFVSVGRLRQINVLVSGEVNYPGQRLVTGLSSAVDALLLSGGVRKTGSLRNIRIRRGGRDYPVDLYSVLTDRGDGASMRLADGDRILVPALGRTVSVTGLVRQPGIYELPAGQPAMSVRALLALAGGQEVRGRYRLSLLRILPDGNTDLSSVASEGAQVRDSEILFVQLGADQMTSQATLSGGTGLAGQYPIIEGTKLSSVLRSPGALGVNPYTLFGVISRRDPRTLLRTVVAFTPVAVLSGAEDLQLQTGDIVRPLTVNEERLVDSTVYRFLQVQARRQEAIRNPILTINAPPATVTTTAPNGQVTRTTQNQPMPGEGLNATMSATDLAAAQQFDIQQIGSKSQTQLAAIANGQALPPFYMRRPDLMTPQQAQQSSLQQQLRQNQALSQPNGLAQNDGQNFVQPGPSDYGYGQGMAVQPQTTDMNQNGQMLPQQQQQQGLLQNYQNDPWQYQQPPAANFQDQGIRPNEFPANREVQTFLALAEQLQVDPLVLVNFFIDHQVTLDGAVRGPGTYYVGPNAVLQDLVQAAGGTVNWADESGVELISTLVDSQSGRSQTQRTQLPLRQGMFASYVVKPHDQFRFNQVFTDAGLGSVTVQGEVRSAGTYRITRGERLSALLARAGGLTSTAYPYGTVFLRRSAAEAERGSYVRAANQVEDELVVAMTRVGSDKISPDTFSAMQSFVNDLRNQKAVGRISIQADPSVLASRPELDPLLEPGDVVYVPQRPSTVSVLGQVMQPGSYPYRAGASVADYLELAGGNTKLADGSDTYVVLPDGSARKIQRSWLNFNSESLPPGSSIVVPRDVTPLDMRQTVIDISQIFSQLAVSIASVAVISR